ncbi:MAG: hypothetical protein ACFFCZ_11065 [Promethearchaeota archaeon]
MSVIRLGVKLILILISQILIFLLLFLDEFFTSFTSVELEISLWVPRVMFLVLPLGLLAILYQIRIDFKCLRSDVAFSSEKNTCFGFLLITHSHHTGTLQKDHEFQIYIGDKPKYICISCFGTFIGVAIAYSLVLLYVFNNYSWSSFLHIFGAILLGLVFLRYIKPNWSKRPRLFFGIALPLGLSLIIIRLDSISSASVLLFALIFSFLLLLIRMQLARLEHENVRSV